MLQFLALALICQLGTSVQRCAADFFTIIITHTLEKCLQQLTAKGLLPSALWWPRGASQPLNCMTSTEGFLKYLNSDRWLITQPSVHIS